MKKISYEEAKTLLKSGQKVRCQTGNREDQFTMVQDLNKLEYLHRLSEEKVQLCKLYQVEQNLDIPENAIVITFDEAFKKLNAGQTVFYECESGEETIYDVSQLIDIRRTKDSRGEELLLLWHE